MSEITDTQRLDFLERHQSDVDFMPSVDGKLPAWSIIPFYPGALGQISLGEFSTLRDAIDSAIEFEAEYVNGAFTPQI